MAGPGEVNETITLALQGQYAGFANLGGLERDMEKIKGHFASLWGAGAAGKAKLGADVGMALAAPFVLLGAEATKAAVKVDDAQRRVQATYQVSQRNMATFSQFVQDNSAKLLQNQTDLWAGIGQVVSQGFGPAMTEAITKSSAKIATVFGVDLPIAIKPALLAAKDFHLTIARIPGSLSLMADAASKTRGGWQALFGSGNVGRVLNLAAAAGLSLPDFLSALVTVSQQTGGGRAVGAIGSLIASIDKMTGGRQALSADGLIGALRAIFAEYGGNQKDLGKALGGGQNILLAQSLLGGGANLSGGVNYLDPAFKANSQTLANQFKALQLGFEDIEVKLGKGLIPILRDFVASLAPILDTVSKWIDKNPALAGGILKAGIAFFAFSAALRVAIPVIQSLGLLMGPQGLVVLGLAGAAVGFYLAYTHLTWFRHGVDATVKDLKLLGTDPQKALEKALGWLRDHWAEAALLLMTGPFSAVIAYLGSKFFPQFTGAIGRVFTAAQGFLVGQWQSLYTWLRKPFDDTANAIQGIGQSIINHLVDGLKAGYDLLPGPVQGLLDRVYSPIKGLASWAFGAGQTTAGNWAAGFRSGAGAISSAISATINGQVSSVRFGAAQTGYATTGVGRGPGAQFGLTTATSTVHSRYDIDQPIIPGAVSDTDYTLPYGAHAQVRLPGGKGDRWVLKNVQYQTGVGWIETWQNIKTGGQIAFLHLSDVNQLGGRNPGGGGTIGATYGAGAVVGTTGWPTDPKFGNGVAGPSNAQLCVVADAAGQQYLVMATPAQQKATGAIPLSNTSGGAVTPTIPTTPGSAAKSAHATLAASLAPLIRSIAGERSELGLDEAKRKGYAVGSSQWLQLTYRIDDLHRAIKDQTAHEDLLRGRIDANTYAHIVGNDLQTRNIQNQQALATYRLGPQGAASHVVPVRIQDQCAEVARANQHRQTTNAKLDGIHHVLDNVLAGVRDVVKAVDHGTAATRQAGQVHDVGDTVMGAVRSAGLAITGAHGG